LTHLLYITTENTRLHSCEQAMLTKEDADKAAKITGKARGAVFQTDAEYIKRKCGPDGINKAKALLKQLGYPIEYSNINALDWYPLGLRLISFLAFKEISEWQEADFKNMGNEAPKYSFIVKLMMKFFISPRIAFSHAPDYWVKHYSVGVLEATEFNEEKNYAITRLKDFNVHSIYCRYLEGYFQKLFQLMLPNKNVKIKETKCVFSNDDYHEFRVEWRN